VEFDDQLKNLVRRVGEAINESLSASEAFNESINRIREEGYELVLVLEVTVGLNKKGLVEAEAAESEAGAARIERDGNGRDGPSNNTIHLQINALDKQFLRSLKIKIDDDEA
jgi:VIT1/CCC1 family predicted Fe2+/Mn2+ transporter